MCVCFLYCILLSVYSIDILYDSILHTFQSYEVIFYTIKNIPLTISLPFFPVLPKGGGRERKGKGNGNIRANNNMNKDMTL